MVGVLFRAFRCLIPVAFCGAVLMPGPPCAQEPVRTLTFAPLPMEAPETVLQQAKPMLSYLETALGVNIRIVYSKGYVELLDRFRRGEIDLAYLGPLPYLSLHDGFAQAEPLVHFVEPSGQAAYTCALVAWDATLEAKGAPVRVALTQPLSTCGYMSTSALLRGMGVDIEAQQHRYLGTHDAVALAVVRGEFALGGLKSAIARKYANLGLRIVAETAPLPSFALVANAATVPAPLRVALREALTALDPTGRDAAMLAHWGENYRHGAVPAADGDYDAVRALGAHGGIPPTGNF